jgi:transposase-like protein
MSLQFDSDQEMPVVLLPEERDRICEKIHGMRGMSAEIARACGIHRTAVYQWRRVPPERVQIVAELTEWTPEQIRPDIFKKPRKRRARSSPD